jgi:hypothetical protein
VGYVVGCGLLALRRASVTGRCPSTLLVVWVAALAWSLGPQRQPRSSP